MVYTKYNRSIAYPSSDLLKYFVTWQMNDHWQTCKSRRFLLLKTLLYQLIILLSESLVLFQAQRSRRSGRTIVDVANCCSLYLVLLFYNFWTGKYNIQLLSQILDFFGTIAISQASNRPWLEKLILMYLCCALIFQTCSFRKMLRRGACLRCLQKFDFPYFENYVLHFSCPVMSKTLCDIFTNHIVISQIGWNVCCQFANSTLIFENNIS